MAPRRSVPQEEAPAAEVIAELQDERTLQAAISSREFFEKFQGEKEVRVPTYKQNADTGRWEYIKTLSPDIADEDYLRKTFGPGVYKFIARGPKSDQYPQGYYGTLTVAIADISAARDAGAAAPENTSVEKMLAALQAENHAAQQRHTEFIERLLMVILAKDSQQNHGADPTKLLEIASGIANKMHEGQQPFNPKELLGNFLEWYDRGFERGQSNEPKDEGYMGVIRDVAKPVVELIAAGAASRAALPAPTPAAIPATQPTQEVHPMKEIKGPLWLNAMTPYFPILLNLAVLNSAPDIVADMVLDKLPEDVLDKIRGDCIAPNWENEIADVLPDPFKVRYREWTVNVLREVKESLTAQDEPPTIGGVEETETGGE